VTNGENVKSVIEILDKDRILLRCKYCSQTLTIDELLF
jgi:aspartate carbamoyltransferase regulatory subunit